MWRFYGGASAALSRHSSVVSVRSIVSVASTSLPQRPPLSIAGQEVGKHFISGDEIDQKLENPTVRWFRAPGMDAFAAELLELHEGSLELEALGGNLQVGQKSTNGLVEHVGEGVYVEQSAIPVDTDSKRSLPTITRPDQRETARLALCLVDDLHSQGKVTVVGQAGIGKTRGGLAYTLQELLWRGEAVLRVGYKNEQAFLFLPGQHGAYKVWRADSSVWSSSELAANALVYALIDPPEEGAYKDRANSRVVKWASNNSKRHYHNWAKDGKLLLTAMPSEAQVLAMVPTLWNQQTPFPGQRFDTAEAQAEEIKKRCSLVGCVLRIVFDHEQFLAHVNGIIAESTKLGLAMSPNELRAYYVGTVDRTDGEASSVTSKMYLINPHACYASPNTFFVKLNPLATFVTRKRLVEAFASFDGKTAYAFEDAVQSVLMKGLLGNTRSDPRAVVRTANHAETTEKVIALRESDNQLVVASNSYALFDFAISSHSWLNAKVGKSTIQINPGAFVKVVKDLKLAKVHSDHDDELQWINDDKPVVTLTLVRNCAETRHAFSDKKSGHGLDAKKLKAFFNQHVDVKTVDVSRFDDVSQTERDAWAYTAVLIKEYKDLSGGEALITPWETTSSDSNDT